MGVGEWQGTTGENPRSDISASVFVAGPYTTTGEVRDAVARARRREIAWPGGMFVVSATKPSYLTSTVTIAAACLAAGTGTQYSF